MIWYALTLMCTRDGENYLLSCITCFSTPIAIYVCYHPCLYICSNSLRYKYGETKCVHVCMCCLRTTLLMFTLFKRLIIETKAFELFVTYVLEMAFNNVKQLQNVDYHKMYD